jgi:hypothetical protein
MERYVHSIVQEVLNWVCALMRVHELLVVNELDWIVNEPFDLVFVRRANYSWHCSLLTSLNCYFYVLELGAEEVSLNSLLVIDVKTPHFFQVG